VRITVSSRSLRRNTRRVSGEALTGPSGAHKVHTAGERGQALVLFVLLSLVLIGSVAIVTDVSWLWYGNQRMQRAADAAALAGAIYLPGDPAKAYSTARDEATKNGFTGGVNGVTVTPLQDTVNKRRLIVTVNGPVGAFFAQALGISSFATSATGRAEYYLPVPMGSPENYYGVFGMTRGIQTARTVTNTNTTNASSNTGTKTPTTAITGGTWTATSGTKQASVQTNDNIYIQTSTNNQLQAFSGFSFGLPTPAANQALTIDGVVVLVSDAFVSASCSSTNIKVDLSWNASNATPTWSTAIATPNLATSTTTGDYTLPSSGGTTSTSAWGGHSWVPSDFSSSNFGLRFTSVKGCGTSGLTLNADQIQVTVYYTMATTTTTTSTQYTSVPDQNLQGPGTACGSGITNCYRADGATLNPRGFWGTMNTQGAENVNGDAYQAFYDTRTSANNPAYDATNYFNYAIEMPPGSTNGSIYVYDPEFCATANNKGTGDRWFGGTAAVSSFFEVYDTKNTLYDISDDGAALASSNDLFRGISAADTAMGGSGGSECVQFTDATYGDGRDYHDQWYLLYSGMSGGSGGRIYRVHTTSTDPANTATQKGTNGENSFALYASASGGTPKLYGLGAMQAFTPLSASGSAVVSEFYLAQIDANYAGKTIEIQLWDPGDTNPLSAVLAILAPTSSGWSPTAMSYTATKSTTNSGAANCNALTGTGVMSVQTNVGATTGTFNGCWLTIRVPIPTGYTAPQQGWWKIRYTMNGNGTSNDVTTWTTRILGNPVHLVVQ
jgi:hypothetical protein